MGMDVNIDPAQLTEREMRFIDESLDAGAWSSREGWVLGGMSGRLHESYQGDPNALPNFVPEAVNHVPTLEAERHIEEGGCEDCESEWCDVGIHGAFYVPYAAATLRERLPRAGISMGLIYLSTHRHQVILF